MSTKPPSYQLKRIHAPVSTSAYTRPATTWMRLAACSDRRMAARNGLDAAAVVAADTKVSKRSGASGGVTAAGVASGAAAAALAASDGKASTR